jgi:hypothetical protein
MPTPKHNYGPKSHKRDEEKGSYFGVTKKLEDRPFLHEDGTIEAVGFSDKSSDGMEFEVLRSNKGITYSKEIDSNTKLHLIPNSVRRYYSTTVAVSHSICDIFAQYKGEIKQIVLSETDRYTKSKKSIKKKIDELAKEKQHYIFTNKPYDSVSEYRAIPYGHSVTFGPYNYPTKLKVTEPLENISDILVIKTGSFNAHYSKKNKNSLTTPANEKVVFVSPHEQQAITGYATTHIGSGKFNSFPDGRGGVILTHTSNQIIIPEGEILKTSVKYYDVKDSPNGTVTINTITPSTSQYVTNYVKAGNATTGSWDGVVPSGAYVRLQTFSSQGKWLGFDGEISVIHDTASVDEKIPFCCSGMFTGVGVDQKYEHSVEKALYAAKQKYYKKLNLTLVANGIKNKSSKMKRYDKMLERVAQGVYDGYGIARNEKAGAAQGTESSPVGSPMYYDGISNVYGGTRGSSNYNYLDVMLDKLSDPIATVLWPPTGIYKGAVSSSSSIGVSTSQDIGGSDGRGTSY